MVFTPTLATADELDAYLDPDCPDFGFATDIWVEAPPYQTSNDGKPVISTTREANADAFKTSTAGSQVAWNRYIQLGYYTFDDCKDFDAYWRHFINKQTICMKMVWFNYKYHVDRQMSINPKLQTWATKVAQQHLDQLEPSFLRMDTTRTTWARILPGILDLDAKFDDRPWQLVGPDTPKASGKTSTGRAPSPLSLPKPPKAQNKSRINSNELGSLSKLSSLRAAATKAIPPPKKDLFQISDASTKATGVASLPTPIPFPQSLSRPATNTTINAWQNPFSPQPTDGDSEMLDEKMAAVPINRSSNDGTSRITIKWKSKDYQSLAGDPVAWLTKFLDILNLLFSDRDGSFYRWESEDLLQSTPISKLTPEELRDFISPKITSINSVTTFAFGIRFSFMKASAAWKNHPTTKRILREQGIQLNVSNSSCNSGDLVIAGYLLFKAPNNTHRDLYYRHLRNNLPDNTPFFDIWLFRKTPTDDAINHLVVRCGKNHVGTLTTSLCGFLTGKGKALFLPRLAFAKLSPDKIKQYFAMHQSYVRSLRPIQLSPSIPSLDTEMSEQTLEGSIQRTPREWATSLTLADGVTNARCDVTDGSTDKHTYLLVPAHNLAEVKIALRNYRFSLNILEQRETRFRDSLPGLPDEIHIDLTTQDNLNFLDTMSNEDIWNSPPPSSKASKKAQQKSAPSLPSNRKSSEAPDELSDDDDETWKPDDDDQTTLNGDKATKPTQSTPPSNRNPQSDDQSLRSAGSLTSVLSRMEAIYDEFKTFTSKSDEQFAKVDVRLTARETTDATILQRMQSNQAETITSMKSQFEGMMAQVMQQLASPTIDPSPTSRRSHSSLTESALTHYSPTPSNHPHGISASLPYPSSPSQGGGSMSTASGESSGSSSFQPQAKKFRSLRTDLSQMSFDSANSEELSALGDVLYPPHHGLAPYPAPLSQSTIQQRSPSDKIPTDAKALPDSNAQYKSPSDSNGGAPS